jgi:vacuolar-type H+-ATPase subunit F/Vma7
MNGNYHITSWMQLSIKESQMLKEIALIADRRTATLFRLAGMKHVFPVDSPEQVEKHFDMVSENPNFLIILATERIVSELQEMKGDITEKQYPLLIPIPSLEGPPTMTIDLINELIKSKAGIEFRLG